MPAGDRLTVRVAQYLKKEILGAYAAQAEIAVAGTSPGGDATFKADAFAEERLADFFEKEKRALAVYTEDRGLVRYGSGEPEALLVIDPIDGTRPFNAEIPVSTISVALADFKERPAFEDIREACLLELGTGRMLFAEGSSEPLISVDGIVVPRRKYPAGELDTMSFAFELAGRPTEHVTALLGELIDRASLKGGVFSFASSAYSISKVVEGTLGAFIDVGGWLLDACLVDDEDAMGLYPYDIAAAWLIARNAGCNITDFYGKPLVDVVLTETGPDNILSCIVTSDIGLHRKVLAYLKGKAENFLGAGCG